MMLDEPAPEIYGSNTSASGTARYEHVDALVPSQKPQIVTSSNFRLKASSLRKTARTIVAFNQAWSKVPFCKSPAKSRHSAVGPGRPRDGKTVWFWPPKNTLLCVSCGDGLPFECHAKSALSRGTGGSTGFLQSSLIEFVSFTLPGLGIVTIAPLADPQYSRGSAGFSGASSAIMVARLWRCRCGAILMSSHFSASTRHILPMPLY
jgi:hypothetical protein